MITAWQNYNKALATANKLTAHGQPDGAGLARNTFFRSNDFFEVEAATVSRRHSPFIVCGPIDGVPVGDTPALRKKVRTVIFFLGHVGNTGTGLTDTLESVQQQTYDLMMQFIARYINDYEATGACGPFGHLSPGRMSFQMIGPTLQGDYGWRLQIEFIENAPEFLYDPSKWTS